MIFRQGSVIIHHKNNARKSIMSNETKLIAPCGMNCSICHAFLRQRNTCPGCYSVDATQWISIARCTIRNCEIWENNESGFCFECQEYPCKKLNHLDKRYRTRYGMSMLENLEYIRDHSLTTFVEKEKDRWCCSECGGTICVHKGYCLECHKSKEVG